MNETDFPLEEKDIPASPKEEDIKIDEVSYPTPVEEASVTTEDQIYKAPIIEEPFEEKVKVTGIESNIPPSVNEMGEIAFGDIGDIVPEPEKTAEEVLRGEEESAKRLTELQKEFKIISSRGEMSLYDWLNKPDKELNLPQSMMAGVISGTLKFGYGFPTFIAKAIDYFGPPETKTSEGKMAKLDEWFNKTWVGQVKTLSEDMAKQTAVGHLTEAFTEIYGAARFGAAGVQGATKIAAIVEELYAATKAGRLIDYSNITVKAAEKANILNNLTGWRKWTAIGIGGGGGIGFLVPSEDLGTLGEIFGGPTKLDRVTQPLAKDDAARFFNNQLKFGAENSIFTVGITGAIGVGKLLATQGKELAYNNSLTERWIDKFASYLRPRGKKSKELLEAVEAAEGRIEASQVTTKDLMDDINKSIVDIRAGTEQLAQSTKFEEFLIKTNEMLHSGDNAVQGNKLVFKGFNNKQLKQYENYLKDIGLNSDQIADLKTKFFRVRDSYNVFMNEILQGKNLDVGAKEFNNIMMDRVKNVLAPEYRMFTEKTVIPYYNYKPSLDSINEIKQILTRNIKAQGGKVLPGDVDILVNNIIKNSELNAVTKAPEFKIPQFDALSDKPVQLVSMADNIVGGKFVPTPIIKTKKEYAAFQKLFGAKQDPRFSIANVMEDLSEFASKDKFANNIKILTENAVKNKQRPIVFKTEIEAQRNFNPPGTPKYFIKEIVPLNIESKLGKLYTNPLNGTYTSKEFADALKFVEKLPFESLNQNPLWRWSTTIPKALVSTAKTVLSLFAHIKNPLQNIALTVGTGNAFKNPKFLLESAKRAFNTVQPQLLYKNLPKDQAFYKYLVERKVVGSSSTYNDVKNLLKDASLGGERITEIIFGRFGQALKNFYRNAQNFYLAEDDAFKIFNFLAEHDTLRIDYANAVKKGLIKSMPSDLQIMDEAAALVRDMFPNYGRVGEGVKALRYSPLGNFPSWTSEMFRNSVNILENSIKEIKNPIRSFTGWKRLTGFTAAVGGILPFYVEQGRALYGITRDQLSAMRAFLFDYEKNATIRPSRNEDGDLMYTNLSSYPYTAISDIFQPVIAGMENVRSNNLDDPLIKTVMIGLGNGFVDASQPFLEESIWKSYYNTVFNNDGVTKDGYRIWNKQAPLTEKWEKAWDYGVKTLGFGSVEQVKRLYKAGFGKPGERGEKYELSDEALGIIGLRRTKLEPLDRLESKVGKFAKDLEDTSALFTGDKILKGGSTDSNKIIERYILANKQRYKVMSEMQQVVNKGKILNLDESEMKKKFANLGQENNFRYLNNDEFNPFNISQRAKGKFGEQAERIQSRFDNLEYTAPLDEATRDRIKDIRDVLKGIPLNKNFDDFINPSDWMLDLRGEGQGSENKVAVAPLPPQPTPNQQVIQQPVNEGGVMQNGLTVSENAYLTESEKAMRLKQRGLS